MVVYVAAQGPLWRSKGGAPRALQDHRRRRVVDQEASSTSSDDTGINEVAPRPPRSRYDLRRLRYQRRRNGSGRADQRRAGVGHPQVDRRGRDVARDHQAASRRETSAGSASPCPPHDPTPSTRSSSSRIENGGFYRSTTAGETWKKRNDIVELRARRARSTTTRSFADARTKPDRVYAMDTWKHARDRGRRRVPSRRSGTGSQQARGQPRPRDRPARTPSYLLVGLRRRRLRELGSGQDVALQGEPPAHAVLQGRGRQRRALLQRLRRHPGQQHPGRPVPDRQSCTASPTATGSSRWGATASSPPVDPSDPNIVYSQWQYGGLVRYDRKTGETGCTSSPSRPRRRAVRSLQLGLAS